jgi:hypothetical protein
METVVGSFWRDENGPRSIGKLEEEDLAQDSIDVLTRMKRNRLVGDRGQRVVGSGGWGAVIGIIVYAMYDLGAALLDSTSCQYNFAFVAGTVVGCAIIGSFVEALLGQWGDADAS